MEVRPPEERAADDERLPPTEPPGETAPNEGGGERKRRRRRSRSGRSGHRGRGSAEAASGDDPQRPGAPPANEGDGRDVPAAEPSGAETETPQGRPREPRARHPRRRGQVREALPPKAERAPASARKKDGDGSNGAKQVKRRVDGEPTGRTTRHSPPDDTTRSRRRDQRAAPVDADAVADTTPVRGPAQPPERRPASRMQLTAAASIAPGRFFWIAVGALTVVALLVRLPGLGSGFWADEIYSVMASFRTPFPETLSVFPGDNKHPLYSLLAHAALTVFGESPWSVRLPALFFGVATVPMLFSLGARVTSRVEAFAASALLALSYHHVWFSQNARGYSALAFFAAFSTLLVLRAMSSEGYRAWLWFGVVAGLGVYTHLTFVFTVIAQFVVVALATAGWPGGERRVPWRGPLVGFALAAGLATVLYLPMLSQVAAFFLHKESNLKGISSPAWALGEAIRVLRVGFGGALGGAGLLVLALGAVIALAGAASYARQSLRTFLLLAFPAVVTMMGAFAARGTMYPRFFFVLAGFAILIGLRGAFVSGAWLSRRLRWSETAGHRMGVGLATVVVLLSALSVPLNWQAPKQDFEGAARYAEQTAGPNDAIVTADVTSSIYGEFYHKTWRAVRTTGELDGLRRADGAAGATRGRTWLIFTFPRYLERFDAGLAAYVRRECTDANVQRFRGTVGDGDVLVCRLEPT